MPEQRDKKENKVVTNLEKFLSSYGNFIADNNSVNMDIDSVLRDISTNIIDPNTDNEKIHRMYKKGSTLHRDMGGDLIPKLKNLK